MTTQFRPIRGVHTQEKAQAQPEFVRDTVIPALLTSDVDEVAPFFLLTISGYPRWGCIGVGRTHDYPTELSFSHESEDARVIVRWGVSAPPLKPGEWLIPMTEVHPAVAGTPLFEQLRAKLEKAGLAFLGVDGFSHVFGGTFEHEGKACSICAQVQYKMHDVLASKRRSPS